MARENSVFLHGQLQASPKIYVDKDGNPIKGILVLKTLRRPIISDGVIMGSKLYFDTPIILTKNLALIKNMYSMRTGDMIDIKGALTTKEVNKATLCPKCGFKNVTEGNTVYVTPIYICRREQELSPEDGIQTLKERSEVSNTIYVIGTLCRNPENYVDEQGRDYSRYQLAVNRKFKIQEDDPSIKTDYPWVKTFGMQAKKDADGLQMGSVIYINGALQTREIQRTTVCESCGEEYHWKETVTEIVPYSTEYLSNCILPEKESEGNGEQSEG